MPERKIVLAGAKNRDTAMECMSLGFTSRGYGVGFAHPPSHSIGKGCIRRIVVSLVSVMLVVAMGCDRSPASIDVKSVGSQNQAAVGEIVGFCEFSVTSSGNAANTSSVAVVFWVKKNLEIVRARVSSNGSEGIIVIDGVQHIIPAKTQSIWIIDANSCVVNIPTIADEYQHIVDLLATPARSGGSMPILAEDRVWMDLVGDQLFG